MNAFSIKEEKEKKEQPKTLKFDEKAIIFKIWESNKLKFEEDWLIFVKTYVIFFEHPKRFCITYTDDIPLNWKFLFMFKAVNDIFSSPILSLLDLNYIPIICLN